MSDACGLVEQKAAIMFVSLKTEYPCIRSSSHMVHALETNQPWIRCTFYNLFVKLFKSLAPGRAAGGNIALNRYYNPSFNAVPTSIS